MNDEELELEELKKRVAANSGLPAAEINRRWDHFINNAVTTGLSKDEGDEIRKKFRRQAERKVRRVAREKVSPDAGAARPQTGEVTARAPEAPAKPAAGETGEAETERMLAEKEAEIARLKSALSRKGVGFREIFSLSRKLGSAQNARDKIKRELKKASGRGIID